MSRGPGRVQRAVYDCLAAVPDQEQRIVLLDIVERVFGRPALSPALRAHVESVRRALMGLERRDIVELFYVKAPTGNHGWLAEQYGDVAPMPRRQLAARIKRPQP
jgi:hypothetical protein